VHAPPISSFSFNPQFGNPPLNVIITDNSTGAGTYTWDFGDGSNSETIQEPVHLYTDTGVFVIRQYVVSPFGCVDSSSKNIYVIKPVLDIAITGDSSYFENNYFHVVCKLKNLGTREINSLQLEAKLENGNTIRESLNDVIPNGPAGYKTYSFHASFLINSANEFSYYCVRAINPNGEQDNAPENNEKCINLSDETIVFDPYPNPFTGTLNMHLLLGNHDYVKADLIDVSGQVVKEIYSGKVSKNYLAFSTDLTDLREGIYSIRVIYRDKVIVRNVVKIKQ
jgi:PKD repeat protein